MCHPDELVAIAIAIAIAIGSRHAGRGDRSVLLDDAVDEAVHHSFAFDEVVLQWRDSVAVVARLELPRCGCAIDRVLDREAHRSSWRHGCRDHREQPVEIATFPVFALLVEHPDGPVRDEGC